MAKKKLGPGKCVHCLKDVEERNSDHVFPESWYPDSTPPNLEKWQIPSCIPCNSEYGKLEQDFCRKGAVAGMELTEPVRDRIVILPRSQAKQDEANRVDVIFVSRSGPSSHGTQG